MVFKAKEQSNGREGRDFRKCFILRPSTQHADYPIVSGHSSGIYFIYGSTFCFYVLHHFSVGPPICAFQTVIPFAALFMVHSWSAFNPCICFIFNTNYRRRKLRLKIGTKCSFRAKKNLLFRIFNIERNFLFLNGLGTSVPNGIVPLLSFWSFLIT